MSTYKIIKNANSIHCNDLESLIIWLKKVLHDSGNMSLQGYANNESYSFIIYENDKDKNDKHLQISG